MAKVVKSGLLEVGDKLIIENCFGCNWFRITRVTKTLAISKRRSDGFEFRFKREIELSMAHPRRAFDTSKYTVERG